MESQSSPRTAVLMGGESEEREISLQSGENIAKALHQNMSGAQHIGQLAHLLGISYRLVKRLIEIMGTKNGQIGVF